MSVTCATLDRDADLETTDMNTLDADKRRSVRARRDNMVVLPDVDSDGLATGIYTVSTESGSTYLVDITEKDRCSCPDMTYNAPKGGCKHRRRVAISITETALPAPGQPLGDYEAVLDETRARLERERATLISDLDSVTSLLDAFDN